MKIKLVLLFTLITFFGNKLHAQEPGNSLDFDGTDDYVNVGTYWQGARMYNNTSFTYFYGDLYFYGRNFTMEAWIKPIDIDGATDQYETVILNGSLSSNTNLQYSMVINRKGFASYRWFDGTAVREIKTAVGSITNNRWQHISITKGSSLNIYINGTLQTTTGDALSEGNVIGGGVFIGASYNSTEFFKGQIDEVHLWKDRIITIPSLYNTVSDLSTGTLWCNLRFNNSSGTNAVSTNSAYQYVVSNGSLTNMDGNTDWAESYAMVVPRMGLTNIGCGQLNISWIAPEVGTVDKYFLEIATDTNMTAIVPAYSPYIDAGNAQSYTFSGLTGGQKYFFRLRAYKGSVGDVGAFSKILSFKVPVDATPPIAIAKDINVYLNALGTASITTNQISNGSSDNCGIKSLSLNKKDFNCTDIGKDTVILTVTDLTDNFATDTAFITVLDTISPIVEGWKDTIYLDASGNASYTPNTLLLGVSSSDNCFIDSYSFKYNKSNFDCSNVGPNFDILTVTDISGNAASDTVYIMVLDTIAPVAKTQNITAYIDGSGNVSVTANQINNASADNCSIQSVALDKTTFDCSNIGDNTVTLTVTDISGNKATNTATVSVLDTIAPIVKTNNISVYLDASNMAIITADLINGESADNCSIQTIDIDKTIFDCSNVGSNLVTLTVTDKSGNKATNTAFVNIMDTVAPVSNCLSDKEISIAYGQTGYIAQGNEFDPSLGTDNCGITTIQNNINSSSTLNGVSFPLGKTNVTWTTTDKSGNWTSCSFNVSVTSLTNVPTIHKSYLIKRSVTNETVTIEADNIEQIAVIDMLGKVLLNKKVSVNTYEINLHGYANGVYIIQFKNNGQINFEKIVIE